jgi:hypothetical protein
MPNKEKLENINWEIDKEIEAIDEIFEDLFSIRSALGDVKENLKEINKMLLEE